MNEPLFRPQVIAERQTQWLGTVLLVPRLSHRFFTAFAAVVTAVLLGFLFFGDYTRKARIKGWLVPQQGMVRVFAPQAGVITRLYVKEGAEVHKGEGLLVVSTELESTALGGTQQEITRKLAERRESLAEERRAQKQLFVQQAASLNDRIAALDLELGALDREISLQNTRVQLAVKSRARQLQLREQGFISDQQLQQAEEAWLEQQSRLRTLERNRITNLRERLTLKAELRDLPIKSQAQISNTERTMAQLEQELAEAEARRELVIPAPQDGTVTAIQAELGGRTNPTVALFSIVPRGAKLEAHMFSPSRGVGFVRPGQRVLLRYQAFPYQKFGHYEARVANVSRTAVSPSELPVQLSGLSSLYGANEPVYRIEATLSGQSINAYGKAVPLQPGMQLEADVVIEKRRLFEWMLDPLFTLTGKWSS